MMRKNHRAAPGGAAIIKRIIVLITVSLILFQLILARRALFPPNIPIVELTSSTRLREHRELFQYFNTKEAEANARQVQASREALSCEDHHNETLVFAAPTSRTNAQPRQYPKRCKYTFLDLGANTGDSLRKFVDAGLSSSCANGAEYRYKGCQGLEKWFNRDSAPRKLTNWVSNTMTRFQQTHGNRFGEPLPELYCYVGVEGNPRFRQELLDLQQCVMQTVPRPLRSVHMVRSIIAPLS